VQNCKGLRPGIDLTSWNHWRLPAVSEAISDVVGPVLVTPSNTTWKQRRYQSLSRPCTNTDASGGAMAHRDGEFAETSRSQTRYLETLVVSSWAEHVRQHDRLTRADSEVRLRQCTRGKPNVRHLLYL
jgi:hypothetical protein